mmetsp:Transcript_91200/g.257130  ORF Transcript_91200/g.257130 Transcript_91200/m.257130 type:complete len:700 (+) Transcript_91200:67-2166(+)
MVRSHLASLACPHCRRVSSVPCTELEEANAVIASLKRLIAQSDLAYFEIDAAGVVTSWNDSAAEVFGAREQDALGQALEDIVAERYRARVAHALAQAQRPGGEQSGLGPLRLAGRGAPQSSEVGIKTVAFHNTHGHFVGAAGLVQLTSEATKAERVALPVPVVGVSAWRCTLRCMGACPPMFELCQGKPGVHDSRCDDEAFQRMVEKTVRSSAATAASSSTPPGGDRLVSFESDVLPFESLGGATRYFSVRGMVTSGPEMPFGGNIGLAEGYVLDITALKNEQQEAAKWHERWRGLAQLAFSFVLLIDITEYRVLNAWGDTQLSLGQHLEGRPLFECVHRDDRAATVDAFSAALSAVGGAHVQALTFKHRYDENKKVQTQCTILSDNGDPSILFLGAEVLKGGESGRLIGVSMNQQAPRNPLPSTSVGGSNTATEEAPAVSSSSAPKASGGLRLTATALGLAGGLGGLPMAPPGLGRKLDARNTVQAAVGGCGGRGGGGDGGGGGGGGGGRGGNVGAGASGGTATDGKPANPTPGPEPSGKKPPTGGGAPSPQQQEPAKQRRSHRVSGAASSNSSRASRASSRVPRVFPTQIVLNDDDGAELWRSGELLLGETMRAAELLTRDSSQRFNMPQQYADALQTDTHELFVLDAPTGELLQIANLASTSLQSLQRHCGAEGKLTLVITPAEDSEDAFETIPAK